jgi:hypothetical protein
LSSMAIDAERDEIVERERVATILERHDVVNLKRFGCATVDAAEAVSCLRCCALAPVAGRASQLPRGLSVVPLPLVRALAGGAASSPVGGVAAGGAEVGEWAHCSMSPPESVTKNGCIS